MSEEVQDSPTPLKEGCYINEVTVNAGVIGQPYDFQAVFTLLTSFLNFGKDFEFTRKPNLEYFTSLNPDAASLIVNPQKKNTKGLMLASAPISRLQLRDVSHGNIFDAMRILIGDVKTRQKISIGDNLITVGARTADFWYTATVNRAGQTVETISLRNDIAAKVRTKLQDGTYPIDCWRALMLDYTSIDLFGEEEKFSFKPEKVKTERVASTPKDPKDRLVSQITNVLKKFDGRLDNDDMVAIFSTVKALYMDYRDTVQLTLVEPQQPCDEGHLGDEGEPGIDDDVDDDVDEDSYDVDNDDDVDEF